MQISSSTNRKKCFEHDLGASMIWLSCIRSQGPLISNPQFSQSRECDQFVQFSEEQVSHIWSLKNTQSIGVEEKMSIFFSTTLIFFTNGKYYFHVENEEPWKGSCFWTYRISSYRPSVETLIAIACSHRTTTVGMPFIPAYGIELLVGNTSQTLRYSPNYNPDVHQPYFVQPQKKCIPLSGQSPSEF